MDTPNPKRPCHDIFSSIQNPNSVPDFNHSDFDSTISSFLLLPDSPSTSIGCSFDRVLSQVLVSASEASGDDSVQDRLIDRTGELAFRLHESSKRFSRMRATLYNSNSWSLPYDLTIKVRNESQTCLYWIFNRCFRALFLANHTTVWRNWGTFSNYLRSVFWQVICQNPFLVSCVLLTICEDMFSWVISLTCL